MGVVVGSSLIALLCYPNYDIGSNQNNRPHCHPYSTIVPNSRVIVCNLVLVMNRNS
jgi:hypothetical protein